MPETIVITRPGEDAKKLAGDLEKKGFHCIIEPILSIKTLYRNADALKKALKHNPQAILVTSKHAISAYATMTNPGSIPVICVAQATADHAFKHGFKNVVKARGTAKSLIAHVKKHYSPARGPILYIRGKDISTDIAAELGKDGFTIESVILYKAVQAKKLSLKLCKAIAEHKVNSVAFFSENTAKTYAGLATSSHLADAHQNITAFCMSKAIADKTKGLLDWKEVTLFPSYLKN